MNMNAAANMYVRIDKNNDGISNSSIGTRLHAKLGDIPGENAVDSSIRSVKNHQAGKNVDQVQRQVAFSNKGRSHFSDYSKAKLIRNPSFIAFRLNFAIHFCA